MNRTIGQILGVHLLEKDQEHWPDYVAFTEMAINTSIKKAPFKVLCSENIPLPVDLFLSREFSINPHAHMLANKMKHLVNKVKSAMHDA